MSADMLQTMGTELANVHLGSGDHASSITADLNRSKPGWLADCATKMADATKKDYQAFRKDT